MEDDLDADAEDQVGSLGEAMGKGAQRNLQEQETRSTSPLQWICTHTLVR